MSFGLSAAGAALVGSVAAPVIGGLLGGSSSGGGSTQSNEMNPNVAKYVYGTDGNSGLLADANSIYSKQMRSGGLNDIQRQGLQMQLQYLNSPQYTQGYNQMMQMGSRLMGAGVAGNPFTSGNGQPTSIKVNSPTMQPFAYQGITQAEAPNYSIQPTITSASKEAQAYFDANPDVAAAYAKDNYGLTPDDFVKAHYEKYGKNEKRNDPKLDMGSTGGLLSFVDSSI